MFVLADAAVISQEETARRHVSSQSPQDCLLDVISTFSVAYILYVFGLTSSSRGKHHHILPINIQILTILKGCSSVVERPLCI
jgi:hypothetical protein